MVIGITINNILRDHLPKLEMVYTTMTGQEPIRPVNPYELEAHFPTTESSNELLEFKPETKADLDKEIVLSAHEEEVEFDVHQLLYVDGSFEVFGSADETISGIIKTLSEKSQNCEHKVILTNLESPRSKCATLFFLSKNFFDMQELFFACNRSEMWEKFDLIITDDPKVLNSKPEGKKTIKVETFFNKTVDSDYTVTTIKEVADDFDAIINKVLHDN